MSIPIIGDLEYASSCCIPTTWIDLSLLDIQKYNDDTSIFSFAIPPNCEYLNLPTCGCLLLLAPDVEHGGGDAIRPYTPISPSELKGSFQLLVKRYDQWGTKCEEGSIFSFFSYNVNPHAYKPKGAVSNYIFQAKVGDNMKFKHVTGNLKIQYPFIGVSSITMIAVGVGIAPMIQALHKLLGEVNDNTNIVLLYGVRNVRDILLRELIESWAKQFYHRFKIVYGVGSRWTNIHFGAKSSQYIPPPAPEGFDALCCHCRDFVEGCVTAEQGWINEDKIRRYGFPPSLDTRVFVCGLPGVYNKLCGARTTKMILEGSALYNLGYTEDMVVKF